MVFSLARLRHSQPPPPFELGGEFLRLHGGLFLRDALGSVALEGPIELFAELKSGDQVIVQVASQSGRSVKCTRALRVTARQREWARPPRPHAAAFARFTQDVRGFFLAQGFHEIHTPTLVPCPGLEPTLEPFRAQVHQDSGKGTAYLFLPTSPEIHLKRAIAEGWTDVFELKNCFRAGENSPHHRPEFIMLEWYRGFADLEMVIADLRALVATLAKAEVPLRVTTFRALFAEILDFQLTPATTAEDLRSLVARRQLHALPTDSFNDLFHRLLIEFIEPSMAELGPLIVRDFPPSMAALARLTCEGWADRFEFYWQGLEIANAFNEVTAPDEQRRRWQGEQEERRRLGTSEVPDDPELIRALESGLPPTGGSALGVERLYMALFEVADIRELSLF